MIPTFKSIMHIVAVSVAITCSAKGIKQPSSYNYLRGVEAMDTIKAMTDLRIEIEPVRKALSLLN